MIGQKNDDDDKGRSGPEEFAAETEKTEQFLKPDERDDADLRLVEHIGIYEDCSKLVKDYEWQQVNEGINGPACPLEV